MSQAPKKKLHLPRSKGGKIVFNLVMALFLAYAEQGKDDEKNQDNRDGGNNWIVSRHKAKERCRLAAFGVCGFFGGEMADGIPSNGDKSTNEQDNSHNNFHLLVSK